MVFDAVVELTPGGGDGAARPAAGSISALGVGPDVGGRGIRVYLVGVKSADEGVVCEVPRVLFLGICLRVMLLCCVKLI